VYCNLFGDKTGDGVADFLDDAYDRIIVRR
jgi:hypothetical protein